MENKDTLFKIDIFLSQIIKYMPLLKYLFSFKVFYTPSQGRIYRTLFFLHRILSMWEMHTVIQNRFPTGVFRYSKLSLTSQSISILSKKIQRISVGF